jgi:hypothetical protein
MALLTSLSVAVLPGCYTWHTPEVSPRQYISEQHPSAVRVVLTDGTPVGLENPRIVGESIVGTAASEGRGRSMDDSVVPLEYVASLEARNLDTPRTVVAVALVAGGLIATLAAIFSNVNHGVGCSPTGC